MKHKKTQEDIEFYTKEYVIEPDEMNDSIDMAPHIQTIPKPNPNAWTSFILGIISSLGWIIPVAGVPITIVGIVLGAVSMRYKRNRGIGIAGFVVNIVFLCCSIAKAIVDIVFYVKGRQK